MRNVFDVLREKEFEILRVRNEIRALRLALPLLQDSENAPVPYNSVQPIEAVQLAPEESSPSVVYESARRKVAATAKRISSRMKRLANPLPTPAA